MTTKHDNTINFVYFMHNYPHGFIFQVWSGSLAEHFNNKFNNLCERHKKSNTAFLHFFTELDTDNQNILLTWVNANYKAFSQLNLN
jgi:hypothetical protein